MTSVHIVMVSFLAVREAAVKLTPHHYHTVRAINFCIRPFAHNGFDSTTILDDIATVSFFAAYYVLLFFFVELYRAMSGESVKLRKLYASYIAFTFAPIAGLAVAYQIHDAVDPSSSNSDGSGQSNLACEKEDEIGIAVCTQTVCADIRFC